MSARWPVRRQLVAKREPVPARPALIPRPTDGYRAQHGVHGLVPVAGEARLAPGRAGNARAVVAGIDGQQRLQHRAAQPSDRGAERRQRPRCCPRPPATRPPARPARLPRRQPPPGAARRAARRAPFAPPAEGPARRWTVTTGQIRQRWQQRCRPPGSPRPAASPWSATTRPTSHEGAQVGDGRAAPMG